MRASGIGLHVVTADVGFGEWELPGWVEGLLRVR